MSAHTPGPWMVVEYEDVEAARADGTFTWASRVFDQDCFDHGRRCGHGGPVGAVYQDVGGGTHTGLPGCIETSLANARLIAAAPDLLAALRALRDWIDAQGPACMDAADAAIAKAEGR